MGELQGAKKLVVVDTSAFMGGLQSLKAEMENYEFVLTTIVEEELDNLSKSENKEKSYKARQALRFIEENEDKFLHMVNEKPLIKFKSMGFDKYKNDNLILGVALVHNAQILSFDRAINSKAKTLGIERLKLMLDTKELERYTGIKELHFDLNLENDNELLSAIYEGRETLDTLSNQYVICWDKDTSQSLGEFKNKDNKLIRVSPKTIKSKFLKELNALNIKQRLAFDLLADKDIMVKVLNGGFGTGKTLLAIAFALQELQNGRYQKIVYMRNNHEVRGTKEIGFLPDGQFNKLLPFVMPLCDHLGGVDAIEMLTRKDELEIVHMGFLRGRNFDNSVILVSECQNLTDEHVKLILGRVGHNSIIIFDGDLQQVDDKIFESGNGLVLMANALRGDILYGQVTLDKVERSNVAELAEKISKFEKTVKFN